MSHVETTDDEDFFPLLIPDFTSFGSDIYVVSTLLFLPILTLYLNF